MVKREIICEYQQLMLRPPVAPEQLYQQAVRNDNPTIEAWRDIWVKNIQTNHARFGSFKEHGLGNLFGKYRYMPVIIAGSGPSLKFNAHELKERGGVPLVSCLHNFHYFEDMGVAPDYYVSLDAGPLAVDEVASEGGEHDADYYWGLTKNRTLIAFIGTDPKLFEKWQGKVYLYNAMIPDAAYQEASDKLELFHTWVSNGGNVLGACLYISKAIFGASTIAFVGADFSFGYDKKFHSWDSKYDAKMGVVSYMFDIYGHKVATWPSYSNFKAWFDFICMRVPGDWVNCSEGGCLGSYADGNLASLKYMDLRDYLSGLNMCDKVKAQCIDPACEGDAGKTLLF